MRYTTIIDITEMRRVWMNPNTSRLYMYLCMKSGYHDDDRDVIRQSGRTLALDTGLSYSAVRNAMLQLLKCGLIRKDGQQLKVTKFVVEQSISRRPRKRTEIDHGSAVQEEARERELELERERKKRLQTNEPSGYEQHIAKLKKRASEGDEEARRKLKFYNVK